MERRESVTESVTVPTYAAAVPHFCPLLPRWWSQHLPAVVVVRAKGDGSLMVRISKAAIEKLVHIRVCNYLGLPVEAPRHAQAVPVDSAAVIEKWWDHRLMGHRDTDLASLAALPSGGSGGRVLAQPQPSPSPSPSASSAPDTRVSTSPTTRERPRTGTFEAAEREREREEDTRWTRKTLPLWRSSQTSYTVGMFAGGSGQGQGQGQGRRVCGSGWGAAALAPAPVALFLGWKKKARRRARTRTRTRTRTKKKKSRHAPPPPPAARRAPGTGSPPRADGDKDKEVRALGISIDYKPRPGRSKAPGVLWKRVPGSGHGASRPWNDNVDVEYGPLDGKLAHHRACTHANNSTSSLSLLLSPAERRPRSHLGGELQQVDDLGVILACRYLQGCYTIVWSF